MKLANLFLITNMYQLLRWVVIVVIILQFVHCLLSKSPNILGGRITLKLHPTHTSNFFVKPPYSHLKVSDSVIPESDDNNKNKYKNIVDTIGIGVSDFIARSLQVCPTYFHFCF